MQQVPPPQPQQQDFMGMMKEAAVRGDQKAMEMMVYFKKKEQESAVEAEMGGEVAALRKQLEKLEGMQKKAALLITSEEPTTRRPIDISRVMVPELDLSSAGTAQNSLYLFESLLSTLEIPSVGGTALQQKQLTQLVDKWCAKRSEVITSLRSTFEAGGSGYQRFTHVVKNFIRPKVAKRDIDPEKDVAEYHYSKLFRGTGMHFSEKLLEFKEMISRLPVKVRGDAAHWIRRIERKAGCQLLLYMDRVVQEELEDGTAEFEKSEIRKDWIVFSAVMAKAIDVKRQFDDEENAAGALSMPSTHTPATNAHSMSPGGRGCQCDGRHCPRNEDKEAMCDIFGDPPMSRIKTMMDLHPAYRAYVDLRRSKEKRRQLHWLQLTEQQREKERMWLSQRKKSREGREQEQAQEPAPATNAHSASSTEQQDMLDKGMEMLQQMRAGFGME